jgi:hypothetical protein
VCLFTPPIKFWLPGPIFTKLGMCFMVPEPISMAYFINPSHQLLLARESLNTFQLLRRIIGGVVFYAVLVVWKESRRSILTKISYLNINHVIYQPKFINIHFIWLLFGSLNVSWRQLYTDFESRKYGNFPYAVQFQRTRMFLRWQFSSPDLIHSNIRAPGRNCHKEVP